MRSLFPRCRNLLTLVVALAASTWVGAQGYPQRFTGITKGAPIQIDEESGDIHRCGQILRLLACLQ